jgi:hypothetical protein
MIDYLRFVAAAGIVIFHLQLPGSMFGLAGLNFFTILLAYFATFKPQSLSSPEPISRHASRLLLPWLLWCLIYGAAKLADWWVNGGQEFEWWMLLTGPAHHTWWLPFAFVVVVLAQRSIYLLCGFVVFVFLLGQFLTGPPFDQWEFAASSVLYGRALALKDRRWLLPVAMICLVMDSGMQFAIAAIAVHVALLWPAASTRWSRLLGHSALPIYLAAPLIAALASRVFQINQTSLFIALLCIIVPLAYTIIMEGWRGQTGKRVPQA